MSTPTPDYGEPWQIEELKKPWNAKMPCGHLRQYGTLGEYAPVHCLACKNANLNATIEQQAETLQSAIELIRRVSTGPATPNDAWQWLKQRGLDKYQHVNPVRKSHDQHA